MSEASQPSAQGATAIAESTQEDFLVLSGECLLLVEGEERQLKAWDFVHCPGGAAHVFVGAGSGPCVMLMVGARRPDDEIVYPVSELALKHGAGVQIEAVEPARRLDQRRIAALRHVVNDDAGRVLDIGGHLAFHGEKPCESLGEIGAASV